MKKIKLIAIVLCIIIGALLTGCGGTDNSPLFDELRPWAESSNSTCTETAEYSFARYLTSEEVDEQFLQQGEDKDKGYKLTKSGKVIYTLKEGKSLSYEDGQISEVNNSGHILIKMEMEVKYKDDLSFIRNSAVRNLYTGKTDKITSYVVLERYSLAALFSYKYTEIEAQAEADNKSFTLVVDYVGSFTQKRAAVYSDKHGTKELKIKSGDYFDNDSVYYLVRAMRSVKNAKKGSSRNFNLAMPYDDIVLGNAQLKTKGVMQKTNTELDKIEVSDSVYNLFNITKSQDEESEDNNKLDCYKTELGLTGKKPGPVINLYYSYYPTALNYSQGIMYSASKVLVKIEYPNHDMSTNAIYKQEYILSAYSNLSV